MQKLQLTYFSNFTMLIYIFKSLVVNYNDSSDANFKLIINYEKT